MQLWVSLCRCSQCNTNTSFIILVFFSFIVSQPRKDNYKFLLIIITGRLCLLPLGSHRNRAVGSQDLLGCFAAYPRQKWVGVSDGKGQSTGKCWSLGGTWGCSDSRVKPCGGWGGVFDGGLTMCDWSHLLPMEWCTGTWSTPAVHRVLCALRKVPFSLVWPCWEISVGISR